MRIVNVTIDEYIVTVHLDLIEARALCESEQKGKNLTGQYSYRIDKPHVNPGEKHIHVYKKGDEIFALNFSGSAHDDSHQTYIPNKVATAIKNKIPEIKIPDDNLIESFQYVDETPIQRILRKSIRG